MYLSTFKNSRYRVCTERRKKLITPAESQSKIRSTPYTRGSKIIHRRQRTIQSTMARGGRSSGSRSSSSGGGLFGAKRTPAPPAPARRAPPPAAPAASHAPAPMQAQVPAQMGGGGGMLSGIGSTIAQGMAFGTGSAIAHRAGKTMKIIFEFIRLQRPLILLFSILSPQSVPWLIHSVVVMPPRSSSSSRSHLR